MDRAQQTAVQELARSRRTQARQALQEARRGESQRLIEEMSLRLGLMRLFLNELNGQEQSLRVARFQEQASPLKGLAETLLERATGNQAARLADSPQTLDAMRWRSTELRQFLIDLSYGQWSLRMDQFARQANQFRGFAESLHELEQLNRNDPLQRHRTVEIEVATLVHTSDLAPEDLGCPICYRNYGEASSLDRAEPPIRLDACCGKVIGRDCLVRWLSDEGKSCPLCRADFIRQRRRRINDEIRRQADVVVVEVAIPNHGTGRNRGRHVRSIPSGGAQAISADHTVSSTEAIARQSEGTATANTMRSEIDLLFLFIEGHLALRSIRNIDDYRARMREIQALNITVNVDAYFIIDRLNAHGQDLASIRRNLRGRDLASIADELYAIVSLGDA